MSPTRTLGIGMRLLRSGVKTGATGGRGGARAWRQPGVPAPCSTDRDAGADLAGDPVVLRDLLEHLLVLGARGHAERAARVEAAARGRVDGAGHVALEEDA